jgi:hypothetical protein
VIRDSRQACGVVFPFAVSTSICRSSVTIRSFLQQLEVAVTTYLSQRLWFFILFLLGVPEISLQ